MHFTHYQITAGKVFAVNPNRKPDPYNGYFDEIGKHSAFETWLSTQPEITADPSIKDGVYKVDDLEIVWQMYDDNPGYEEWTTSKNHERDRNNGYITRQYATLKQPVKQEEKHLSAQLTIGDTSFTKLADGFIQILTKNGCVELVPEEINELSKFINPLPHDLPHYLHHPNQRINIIGVCFGWMGYL